MPRPTSFTYRDKLLSSARGWPGWEGVESANPAGREGVTSSPVDAATLSTWVKPKGCGLARSGVTRGMG
jgi:hypothetical protein